VWSLFRILMDISLLKPIVRPITRLIVGFIAVPCFRLFTRHVLRIERLDAELEKDLEQWFRGALLLLVATQNMETALFPWVEPVIEARFAKYMAERESASGEEVTPKLAVKDNDSGWVLLGLRVMLAIGVIQMMPDQELFAVIHHGPPKLDIDRRKKLWPQIRRRAWPVLKGYVCVHINRSSPVFAILAAIAPGRPGWICYSMALLQYLIIGLITSRDKAMDVITIFDETVQRRREELVKEFELEDAVPPAPVAHELASPPVAATGSAAEAIESQSDAASIDPAPRTSVPVPAPRPE